MRVGIIGGGLMGRETASALARWFTLEESARGRRLDRESFAKAELVAVCDTNPETLAWYNNVPTVTQFTSNYEDLLENDQVDVVYVAVPHNLHKQIYLDVLEAGKDMLAEKPFGIDLEAAHAIYEAVEMSGSFVRCSSEFPFYPMVQRAFQIVSEGGIGIPIEGKCAFSHSSDLDFNKPINWKRQTSTCGQIGVMGDLGLHVCQLPFRLGIEPTRVFAQLQKLVDERPDGKGGMAKCDTWDNAWLHCDCSWGNRELPFSFVTRRMAPGEMNTWEFEFLGTEGGVRVSTKNPKCLWKFELAGKDQRWVQIDVGAKGAFKTITGDIFEFGFPDAILQMWASFAAERAGALGDRFGCATPEEALMSHRLFDAALRSGREKAVAFLT